MCVIIEGDHPQLASGIQLIGYVLSKAVICPKTGKQSIVEEGHGE